jgi:TM2 domain-containing membrane protein YozV
MATDDNKDEPETDFEVLEEDSNEPQEFEGDNFTPDTQPEPTEHSPPVDQSPPQPQPTGAQKGADEVFCSSCGEIIKEQAEICPHCGVRQKNSVAGDQKNPGIAAAASFVFTGLGQVYNGQIMKGVLFIIVQAINIALMFAVIGFITFPLVWIYGVYDAYNVAKNINAGQVHV